MRPTEQNLIAVKASWPAGNAGPGTRRAGRWLSLLALLAAGLASATPQRIVSINLCADQLLLTLLPRERLVSVTYLAADPTQSMMAEQARGLPVNHGRADEVVRLKPDLVVAGRYSQTQTVSLLRALGIDVLELDVPASTDQLIQQVKDLGQRLGVSGTADTEIQRFRRTLDALDQSALPNRPLAALYRVNRGTEGRNTLIGELMHRAGMRNVADELGVRRWGTLPLESLLLAQPDIVLVEQSSDRQPAMAHQFLQHPALRHLLAKTQTAVLDNRGWRCAGPWLTQSLAQLVETRSRWSATRADPTPVQAPP